MHIPQHWRIRRQRYRLIGEICESCGRVLFPPRDTCPYCAEPAQTPHSLSGQGVVYSFSVMYDAPEGFDAYTPYTVALIKLEEGPMVTAQLTDVDPEEVQIGMPVEMVTRKLTEEGPEGQIQYGYKFRPRLR